MLSFLFWTVLWIALSVMGARIFHFEFSKMRDNMAVGVLVIVILITQGLGFAIFFCGSALGVAWFFQDPISRRLGN